VHTWSKILPQGLQQFCFILQNPERSKIEPEGTMGQQRAAGKWKAKIHQSSFG
jgi:hypothetical protein